MQKHALWVSCSSGGSVETSTPLKREAVDRWNYLAFIERFGWIPPWEYVLLPIDLKQDMIVIAGIRDSKQQSSTPPKP
jgi:hypothetical protein